MQKKLYWFLSLALLFLCTSAVHSQSSGEVTDAEGAKQLNAKDTTVTNLSKKTQTLILNTGNGGNCTLVFVEGGTFTMGCTEEQGAYCDDNEKPVHKVTLSDFYLGETEVTNIQYCFFLNEEGNKKEGRFTLINLKHSDIEKVKDKYVPKSGKGQHPVRYVSWYGAQAYCDWLSKKTGKEVRLPTEAQWEFAARGGNDSEGYKYAGSNKLDEVAWYIHTTNDSDTKPVATKKANELGIYDMSGNVYEWCSDWYGRDYYASSAATDPEGPESGSYRVKRGGCWNYDTQHCRSAFRFSNSPDGRDYHLGFRIAIRP